MVSYDLVEAWSGACRCDAPQADLGCSGSPVGAIRAARKPDTVPGGSNPHPEVKAAAPMEVARVFPAPHDCPAMAPEIKIPAPWNRSPNMKMAVSKVSVLT